MTGPLSIISDFVVASAPLEGLRPQGVKFWPRGGLGGGGGSGGGGRRSEGTEEGAREGGQASRIASVHCRDKINHKIPSPFAKG